MDVASPRPDSRTLDPTAPEQARPKTMDALIVRGGRRLSGRVEISGAKNAALPLMAATLLTSGVHTLRNMPLLSDTRTMARVLETLGRRWPSTATPASWTPPMSFRSKRPTTWWRTMRASVYVLGPLLARFGAAARLAAGRLRLGSAPINLHLEASTR